MSYKYPYGNTEQMNLDWFLNQWEKFKADWAEAEDGIDGSLDAEIAKVEAAMSELYAARDAAAASASAARKSSLDAAAAQVAAGNSKTAAQAAETSARGSQQAAAQSAQEAQASAQGAENSALTASQAANTATQQAAGADAAKGAAEAAQQAAEDAQAEAAQSAGQAGQAATAAADHADNAADSATLAQQAAQDMSDSVAQITTNKNDISDLKTAFSEFDYSVGTYLQKFTMNNQYLATYYTRNFGSIYFKLLTHPSATFAGVRIYGVTDSTETEITSGNFIHEEFYLSGISETYERIKITVGFGSRVSGDIYVLLACAGGNDISSLAVGTSLNLKDLVRSVDKGLTGDLYKDVPFIQGKNITTDFSKCTIDTYLDIIRDSAIGSIASRAVKIRNDDGTLITPIYFVVPSSLDNNSATMCFTFDKDGNPIGNISGAHLNDGFADNVYYIVLVNYQNNAAVSAIYDSTKEYTFEVSASGKPFTAFSDCVKRIANIPYRKKVLVYAGEYDIYAEIGGDTFANSIPTDTNWRTVNPVVEDNTRVIGIGRVILRMTPTTINANASTLLSPLNISGNVTVENISVECSNTRYGIHIEGSTLEKYNNSVCTLKNVRVTRYQATEGPTANGPAIGVGMNARSRLVFDNCYVNAVGGWAGLYFHENTTTLELSPSLQISDSVFKVRSGYALALSASANQTTMIDVFIAGSYIEQIRKMTGGSSAFNDAYKIVMTNCNAPDFSKSDLLQNEVAVEQYNTIS